MKGEDDDARAVEQMTAVAADERELEQAAIWVRDRGGPGQVAEDVLKMTAGDASYKACSAALEKIEAPGWVYSIINRALYHRRKR